MKSDKTGHVDTPKHALTCGVIVCDGAGVITHLSPEAESIIRLPASKTVGQAISVLPAEVYKVIDSILSGRENFLVRQLNLNDGEADFVTVCAHASAFALAGGTAKGALVILENLSEARRLQQNMTRLDRLANVGTLAAGFAHEIKNGLVAVKTFVDLLLEKNHDADLAAVVSREMKRIDALTGQMLRVAHPAKVGVTVVPIHELLDHTIRLIQHQLDDKKIVVRRAYNAAPDAVNGNGYQLEQVFMNLVLNALEAMGPHGELAVNTEIVAETDKPAQMIITFHDTGVGIPAENLSRVFDTFFTTKKNGTGLGLAITRRIIHEHGGEVLVASRPNGGATFKLLLPLAAA